MQELNSVSQHIQHLFGGENQEKIDRLQQFKQRFYQRFGKHIQASKECLANQLERGALKLRA